MAGTRLPLHSSPQCSCQTQRGSYQSSLSGFAFLSCLSAPPTSLHPLHPLFSVLALVLYLESKNADTRSLCTWQGLDTTGYMHFLTLPGLPLLGVSWGEMCLYLFYVVVLIDRTTEMHASLPRNAVWDYFTLSKNGLGRKLEQNRSTGNFFICINLDI